MVLIYSARLLLLVALAVISLHQSIGDDVNPFVRLFGDTLYKWSADRNEIVEQNTTQLLKNKNAVAVYFSASWCGPCKKFTPQLAQFYKDMNKKGKKFEVVWVSRDQTEDEFVQYYQEMPWLAVTIENIQKCVEATTNVYQVRGIPHLVILDGVDATVYTLDGRTKVLQDEYGLEFPWRPRTPGMLVKQFVPRSVRALVARHVNGAKQKVLSFLRGVFESFLPASLIRKLLGDA